MDHRTNGGRVKLFAWTKESGKRTWRETVEKQQEELQKFNVCTESSAKLPWHIFVSCNVFWFASETPHGI